MTLDKKLLDILACPDCRGDIKYSIKGKKESLKCLKCKRIFEVRDGIPIMLPKDSEEQ
jgi:uncharacterized protein YbaR (Trm112 family)